MRRRQSEKREVPLDPIYNDAVVTRLINKIMIGGKKSKKGRGYGLWSLGGFI